MARQDADVAEIPGATAPTTPEAVALTNLWMQRLPGSRPATHQLKQTEHSRWVRFHSLPESKRYAETLTEYRELLRRHTVVLDELMALTGGRELLVITATWSQGPEQLDHETELIALMRGAWPWIRFDMDEDGECWWDLSVSHLDRQSPRLVSLLRRAADEMAVNVIIADLDLTWLYLPYDGGADVIAPTPQIRDALRARHQGWLSKYPGGY